jgi:hypothetical protein
MTNLGAILTARQTTSKFATDTLQQAGYVALVSPAVRSPMDASQEINHDETGICIVMVA